MLTILIYFASGGCVDDYVNNRINHQFTSSIVIHFMNSARVCWIIKRTVFNVYVFLNHSWKYEHNQSEDVMKHQDIKDSFFKIQAIFILSVYLQHLLNILYCTQNCKFYYFLETKICFVEKNCSISSQVYLFILSKNQ